MVVLGEYADGMSPGHIHKEVDEALFAFVDRQRPVLRAISDDLDPLASALAAFLAGGKRLRPAFCHWGWRGAGGAGRPQIVTAAASLELLQASALIHDDVMDASDTRRGRPSVHRHFQSMRDDGGRPGAAAAFGVSAAILLGDLCLAWSGQMYDESGLADAALRRGRPVYDLMRTEMTSGQYLDMLEQARGPGTVESALRVIVFKSAKYTIERPLHLGAALAGAPASVADAYSAYGLPLGIAFQLRDDVLGVFGDPAVTGKPAGDDLREGKRTVLIALALRAATPAQAEIVRARLGDRGLAPGGIAALRSVIVDTGALAACEEMIDSYAAEAMAALRDAPITPEAREALADLAVAATSRRGLRRPGPRPTSPGGGPDTVQIRLNTWAQIGPCLLCRMSRSRACPTRPSVDWTGRPVRPTHGRDHRAPAAHRNPAGQRVGGRRAGCRPAISAAGCCWRWPS
jgi:geranylgeranyl diphosphate synthase type I